MKSVRRLEGVEIYNQRRPFNRNGNCYILNKN